MLIQFIVENFLSFESETIFNLISTAQKEHQEQQIKTTKGFSLLSISALYGANASGKSNLIKAIAFAKDLIIQGTKPDQIIPQKFFRLNKDCFTKPSKFEFLIYIDSKIYHYYFSFDKYKIHEEWLYVKKNKKFVKYFDRLVSDNGESKYNFGTSFINKSSKKDYQFYEFVMKGTRKNQLFLTEAIEKNIDNLKALYDWFHYTLDIIHADSLYALLPFRTKEDEKFSNFLGSILKKISTDIEGIHSNEIHIDFEKQFPDMPENIKNDIVNKVNQNAGFIISEGGKQYSIFQDENEKLTLLKLNIKHKIKGTNDTINFELEEESDGTQRFIHLTPALVNLINNKKVMFIDELDRRLHPLLSKLFIEIYLRLRHNNSQLIFATHEVNLLNSKILRRDEIWFAEKDEHGASHLTSLAEFKVRDDLNIQKGYLNGRFGAIPMMGSIENLFTNERTRITIENFQKKASFK